MSKKIAVFKTHLDLGKIDYLNNGKRSCPVKVDIELSLHANADGIEYYAFSAMGAILNHKGTNIYHAGQCLDEINKFKHANKDFAKVYEWWKEYHLNDMNAGTREQMKALEEFRKTKGYYNYREECEYLKSLDLYEVEFYGYTLGKTYNGEPYRYGTEWVINFIPEDVVTDMKAFIGNHDGKAYLYNGEVFGKDITEVVWKKGA